jgi:hypothetical protein
MKHSIPCPECDSRGLKTSLEEAESGKIYRCPRCGSRFARSEKPVRELAQGCGFVIFMEICCTLLFVLFVMLSPTNPPWYYFAIGLVVLLVMLVLLSKAVFSRMADKINASSLRRINDED